MSDATSTMLPELGDIADVQHGAFHRDDTDTARFGTGRCGLLRDSDPYAGPSGFANRNWCVEFTQAVA